MEDEPFIDNKLLPLSQMQSTRRRQSLLTGCVIASFLVCFILFQLGAHYGSSPPIADAVSTPNAGPTNATLGFGEIILLNLAERTDRRDAVSLISSISGITITTVLDAVKGEDVSEKAKPLGNKLIDQAHLGSWRSHVDAFRYIVDNKIETALLLEDDVDWYA